MRMGHIDSLRQKHFASVCFMTGLRQTKGRRTWHMHAKQVTEVKATATNGCKYEETNKGISPLNHLWSQNIAT